jgi:hypothetical protein
MMEEEESKKNIKKKNIDTVQKGSEGIAESLPDVCETPSPGGPIPIPYPNIAKSSDTSKGIKKVKTEGKEAMTKASSYKKSTGDEPSHVSEMEKIDTEKNAGIGMIKRVMKVKKFGIPVWLWSFIIVVGFLAIWLLSSNIMPPIEPYDSTLD